MEKNNFNKIEDETVTSESEESFIEEDAESGEKTKLPFAYDVVSVLCSALITIMLVFTFLFRFVGVIGPSMQPNLYEGDRLIVTAAKKTFSCGDIVISTQPNAFDEPIVKRVIATGGQTVKIDFDRSIVYVDGKPLEEDYVKGRTIDSEGFSGEVVVPEGKLFVLGDNREHSTDSRSEAIGMLDERYIIGKVKFRIAPVNAFKYFE